MGTTHTAGKFEFWGVAYRFDMERPTSRHAMDYKEIETFRSVMQTRSMTLSAATLHTSQPNVSRLIARLQRELGFQLFQRVGLRLVPTPEAEAVTTACHVIGVAEAGTEAGETDVGSGSNRGIAFCRSGRGDEGRWQSRSGGGKSNRMGRPQRRCGSDEGDATGGCTTTAASRGIRARGSGAL